MTANGPTVNASMRQPRPGSNTVSLEQWSTQIAPLREPQRASVALLADWLNKHTAPSGLALTDNGDGDVGETSRQGLERQALEEQAYSHGTDEGHALPTQPLSDASSYLGWASAQQRSLLSREQRRRRAGLRDLSRAADEAQALLDHLEAARVHIAELRAGAQSVEEGSEDLRDEAESMVESIDHLSKLTEALSIRLAYFNILPASTSFLSSPSLSLVMSDDFLLTMQRLDVALAFVHAHPHYRDAAVYRMRFEHCVVRAGTLIRMYVMSRFSSLATETSVKLKEWSRTQTDKNKERDFRDDGDMVKTLADPPVAALLYTRFEDEAQDIRKLIHELERRATRRASDAKADDGAHRPLDVAESDKEGPRGEAGLLADFNVEPGDSDVEAAGAQIAHDTIEEIFRAPEFGTLLEECRTAYFDSRRMLLTDIVQACVAQHEVAANNDTKAGTHENSNVRFVERAVRYLTEVARVEFDLYTKSFNHTRHHPASVKALAKYIAGLSSAFDDRMRPRLYRESVLTALSTICIALVDTARHGDVDIAAVAPYVAAETIGEAQYRLGAFARTTITGKQIGGFSPSEDDLEYPARLKKSHRRAPSIGGAGLLEAAAKLEVEGMNDVDTRRSIVPQNQQIRLFALPPKHVLASWYSPLVATLKLLSELSPALPAKAFETLANDAIQACRSNLMAAGQKMAAQGGFGAGRIGAASRMDVPLFLLRHLLILQEMSASVELRLTSSGSFAVDRHAADVDQGVSRSSGGVVDFGKLVATLNSLWNGMRGSAPAQNRENQPLPRSDPPEHAVPMSDLARSQIDSDVIMVREQLIEVIAQGVCLPLRVYLDQRSRVGRTYSTSQPTSPLKDFTATGPCSPSSASARREGSEAPTAAATPSAAIVAKARSAMQAFETCARTNLSEANEALRLYIEDTRTIQSLIEHIVARILSIYDAFVNNLVEAGITKEEVPQFLDRAECENVLTTYLPVSTSSAAS